MLKIIPRSRIHRTNILRFFYITLEQYGIFCFNFAIPSFKAIFIWLKVLILCVCHVLFFFWRFILPTNISYCPPVPETSKGPEWYKITILEEFNLCVCLSIVKHIFTESLQSFEYLTMNKSEKFIALRREEKDIEHRELIYFFSDINSRKKLE